MGVLLRIGGNCSPFRAKAAHFPGHLPTLPAWEEAPFYAERERAALLWTEAVTLVAQSHVPDEVYEKVRPHFTDEELVNLTLAIIAINGWNRLAISFRSVAGAYQPRQH